MKRGFVAALRRAIRDRATECESGFSLLELAVALSLVGLLTAGGMLLQKAWDDQRKRAETWEYMQEVKLAIVAYARVNKRMPCADNPVLGLDGREDTGQFGYLPYATLGVRPMDAWGRRLKYAVSRELYTTTMCAQLREYSAALSSSTSIYEIKVYNVQGGTKSYVPAVLVSGGGRDADAVGGTTPADAPDRIFDSLSGYTNNYSSVTYPPQSTYVSSTPRAGFDDLVLSLDALDLYYQACATPNTPP